MASGQRGNAVQKACRKGAAEKGTPQRHRIAGNAAVVAKGQRDNAVQKACREGAAEKGQRDNAVQKACRKGAAGKDFPQRHRITEFAAVVAKGQRDNAVQKACRKGAAGKDFPQRHRIAEFAAVMAKGQATDQKAATRLFEVLRCAENGVHGSVDANAVGVDN